VAGLNRLNPAGECPASSVDRQTGDGDDRFSKERLAASIFLVSLYVELAHTGPRDA
jgi:hypothetical protein